MEESDEGWLRGLCDATLFVFELWGESCVVEETPPLIMKSASTSEMAVLEKITSYCEESI